MDGNAFATIAFSMALAFSVIMAFLLKEFLVKIFGGVGHIFARSFTTSIEVKEEGRGRNVTRWLNHLIEYNCGNRLRHFGVAFDIINFNVGRVGRRRFNYNFLEDFDDDWDDDMKQEKDMRGDIRKQLGPLQIDRSVFFFHKWTLIGVSRIVRPELRSNKSPTEVYTITAYGTRNKQLLIEMLEEACKRLEKKPSKHINYFKATHAMGHSEWRLLQRFQPRSLSSIVLKAGLIDAIQKDLEEFIESKKWYKDRGIPYRRGYLLYGPPGCGKTSLVKAIAGQFGYDIHELQLSTEKLTEETLGYLMSTITRKAILLFEDVDAIFVPTIQDEANIDHHDGLYGKMKIRESKYKLSFSGLLNAIDGATSEENYILFMTTNQIEKLDSALIRPGRIDMRQLVDSPDEQQIASFFRTFYPDCNDDVAVSFAKAVTNLKCNPTMAQIQGIFLKHKHTPEDNLLDVDTLIEVCKSNTDLGLRNIYL